MPLLRRASLAQKISAANLIGLALLAAALLFLYQTAMSDYADGQAQRRLDSAERVAWDILKRGGDQFRVADGKLLVGQTVLNDRNEIVDRVKDLVGGVATVFMGDMRVATNVKKADGSRAVGTKLAAGPVYDAVFKRGESYRGTADILGQGYFTAYDPIKDASGATVGVLFVGLLEAETHAAIAETHRWAMALAVVIALAIGVAMLLLSSRMFSPLVRLRAAMAKISGGHLDEPTPCADRGDDIGEMARAVEVFRRTALDKLSLDAQSGKQRAEAETERRRNEVARAAASEEQSRTLAQLANALKKVADGDLAMRIREGFPKAYQQICDDFNSTVTSLREALSVVARGADAVSHAAKEIASASDALSQRTEGQAANLEETAASLDRVTETVGKTAELASRAREAVSAAGQEADKGGTIVHVAIEAMRRIENSSQQINDILGVIHEIAFQTNLLALNAGVEAARAGDAGRGFAVVAAEVRALAQRSGEAAKQIAALVSSSAGEVADGVAKVDETGEALSRITVEVAKINSMIAEIAAGAAEQSSGLREVNAAVAQIGRAVQENASMAQHTNAAGASLFDEAENLSNSISHFRLADGAERAETVGSVRASPQEGLRLAS